MSFFFDIPKIELKPGSGVWEAADPCTQCRLRNQKMTHQSVQSKGSEAADVYFVGEAPGAQEVEQGIPFVGKSGQLLRRLIPPTHVERVRFGNVVMCRPSDKNDTPDSFTQHRCFNFLKEDIAKTQPRIVIALGAVATNNFVGMGGSTGRWRGHVFPYDCLGHPVWVFPTYHPAFILRQERRTWGLPSSKEGQAFAWDLQRAFKALEYFPAPEITTPNRDGIVRAANCNANQWAKVMTVMDWLEKKTSLACDLETVGLRPYEEKAQLLSIAIGTGDVVLAMDLRPWEHRERYDKLFARIQKLLLNNDIVKVFHNAIFDLEWLGAVWGKKFIRGVRAECTMAQAYVLNSGQGALDLDSLVRTYLGTGIKYLSDAIDVTALAVAPVNAVLDYNGLDVKYTHRVYKAQCHRIKVEGRMKLFERQMRRIPTFVHAQLCGVPVDRSCLGDTKRRLQKELWEVQAHLKTNRDVMVWRLLKGVDLNTASPQQLCEFFEQIVKTDKINVKDKYGNDKRSVDEEVLKTIDHPVAGWVLQARKLEKLLGTYVEAYEKKWIYPDGHIHTNYNLLRTLTGRTASSNPNQQNWPSRVNKWIKKQFAAPEGYSYIKADQGQIEARIIGVHSKDMYYCKALRERYDIHQEWALKIAHAYPKVIGGKKYIEDKGVMKRFRTEVKNTWTFPAFYGAQPTSIAEYLNIPPTVVFPLFEEFWSTFSGVKRWQQQLISFFQRYGYVESLTGRRRCAPASVNEILNSPIQGDSSDVVVEAMDELSERAEAEDKPYLQAVINIHDDLTFCVRDDLIEQALSEIVPVMLYPKLDWLDVPLSVEVEVGKDLGSTKPIGVYYSDD